MAGKKLPTKEQSTILLDIFLGGASAVFGFYAKGKLTGYNETLGIAGGGMTSAGSRYGGKHLLKKIGVTNDAQFIELARQAILRVGIGAILTPQALVNVFTDIFDSGDGDPSNAVTPLSGPGMPIDV